MTLTAASVAAAEPGTTLNDSVVPGLSVRALPKRKAYYLYFRTKDGTQRRPKIGDVRVMTLAQAREVARGMLLQVANGKDPMVERQVRKDAPSVNELADRYWKRHASKQKSYRDIERHLDKHIRPLLGKKRVVDVTYRDCEMLFDRVAAEAPIQANRVLATFSKMLSLAERWEWRPLNSNPCKRVARTSEVDRKRRRHMTGLEAPKIAAALAKHAETAPASVAFLYLLILSGARKGEIAQARWDWINGSVLNLPDSKTGFRQIHLPPQVVALLEKLPRTSGTLTGIQDPTTVWQQVRAEAGCPDLRLHDLRRSFASAALSAGLTLAQVGELLGHKNAQTTRGYAYLMSDAATAAATLAANRISELMAGPPVDPATPPQSVLPEPQPQ